MSKSRQDTIEFDRNYCAHYSPQPGSKTDYCALGCDASARMKAAREKGSEPNMAPCIEGHNTDALKLCPKWERRSLEHAEARADSFEKAMRQMDVVMPFVNNWRMKPKPLRDRAEVVECPQCKGRLHLSQSSCNGHVHGQCETEDCVSWME